MKSAAQRCALVMLGALTAALGCDGRRSSPVDTATSSPAHPREGARAQPQPPQPQPAPAFGLELRLLALQTTYALEGDGQRLRNRLEDARYAEAGDRAAIAREPDLPSKIRKSLELLTNYAPDPLPVRLALEVANRTAAPLEILPDGDGSFTLRLVLKGPAVAVMRKGGLVTGGGREAEPVSIAPGQSYRLAIRRWPTMWAARRNAPTGPAPEIFDHRNGRDEAETCAARGTGQRGWLCVGHAHE